MPGTNVTERVLRGTANSPLPPSVEAAYYQKCIELKRRVEEIEINNDKMRLSIDRHNRAIKKLRLERALLLDALVRQTSDKASDSDKSSSPPPTPQEKPTRTKRKAKQTTPATDGPAAANTSPAHPAQSTPVATTENASGATFIPYSQPSGSSPPTANGPEGVQLPPIQAAPPPTYGNGEPSEDVSMSEDGPSFGGGFTAVNRS